MGWKHLSEEQRASLYKRYIAGENRIALAQEVAMNPSTLERRLREWAQERRGTGLKNAPHYTQHPAELPQGGIIRTIPATATEGSEIQIHLAEPVQVKSQEPTDDELFIVLKNAKTISLDDLSRKYDRSKDTIRKWIGRMKEGGYMIEEEIDRVSFDASVPRKGSFDLPGTLADEAGQEVAFASFGDPHCGSSHAQPTNLNKFIEIAYHEYGVRHMLVPGDITTGIGGYRGQEQDLIPASRHFSPKSFYMVTNQQIDLANAYFPELPGLKYYVLGGNHDWWHVINTGIDAVGQFCRMRDDCIFLGYDVADIPLTDKVDVRLHHPTGGVPYAVSYRLQKSLEQMAFDELTAAIEASENPRMRILLSGHLHIEAEVHRGPMLGVQVGCFEGQTNYLQRKGLYPQIGGAIFRMRLSDAGMIQRTEYTFVDFTEIHNDYENWPQPQWGDEVVLSRDKVNTLFHYVEDENEMDHERPVNYN